MAQYQFVNLEQRNDTIDNQPIYLSQTRTPQIIENTSSYNIAIDRFSVSKGWLPMYEDFYDLNIRMIKVLDSTTFTRTIDFSAVADTNNLVWDAEHFIGMFNNTMIDLCDDFGIVSTDVPVLSLNKETFKSTLTYTTTTDYVNDYRIQFNEALFCILSGFPYQLIGFSQEYFELSLSGTSIITNEKIRLSPVSKIYIRTSGIPLISEFTQFTNISQSSLSEPILTDFNFNGANQNALIDIDYQGTTGQYRFHSMYEAMFSEVNLQFFWKSYNNNSYPLYILPSGSCDVKLVFKRI